MEGLATRAEETVLEEAFVTIRWEFVIVFWDIMGSNVNTRQPPLGDTTASFHVVEL